MPVAEGLGAIKEVGALLNKLFGGYKRRLRESLIQTGDNLIKTYQMKGLSSQRKSKLMKHFCRQWKANRKKLK